MQPSVSNINELLDIFTHNYLLAKYFPAWSEWQRVTTCSETCGESGFYELLRNCSTGRNSDCQKGGGGTYYQVVLCNEGPCPGGKYNTQ